VLEQKLEGTLDHELGQAMELIAHCMCHTDATRMCVCLML